MCTSFIHRGGNDVIIGMNFDNNGMPYDLHTNGPNGAFVVRVDGGWGKKPSFGVTPAGMFANNLFVDAPPDGKGAYKRASATRKHTQALAEYVLAGDVSCKAFPTWLDKMEIVNSPGQSCHNLVVDDMGNAWVVEPGRGHRESPRDESPWFVMANCPLVGRAPGAAPAGDGATRHLLAETLFAQAGNALDVTDAFAVLRQVAQTEGEWLTAFSMVYSAAARAVYYCRNRQFDTVEKHLFE